jgi:hypothetical protein
MMANNLHISYDLKASGQNYGALIEKIKELGNWAKIHDSFWYVKSTYTAAQARDYLLPTLDGNDLLYVVDSTNNQAGWTTSTSAKVTTFIKDKWIS